MLNIRYVDGTILLMSRKLIFCRDINPNSFVLLFTKGETGTSWSIRDYAIPQSVSVRYAREFPFTLADLNQRTAITLDAPTTSTDDLDFWHHLISKVNAEHQLRNTFALSLTVRTGEPEPSSSYPLLNKEQLYALPKAAKKHDMDRIRKSPNSEDWVTWNVFALIQQVAPDHWWAQLVLLAGKDSSSLSLPSGWELQPNVSLWQCRPTPPAYENASRQRMSQSGHGPWIQRAKSSTLVEGESEIDVSLRSPTMTVFIEAKLGSDISLTTTHDPTRNQIVRNIDCLLEECGDTTPLFWMLVRDLGTMRAYTQLMRKYRDDPSVLKAMLPHRDTASLNAVAANLALIRWSDLLTACCPELVDDSLTDVYQELRRRVI